MSDKSEFKVGEWVHVIMVGFGSKESAYQIESIEGKDYTAVQREGSYEHRVTVKKRKLRKL